MYKRLPKIVGQITTMTCWAAGLESWLDVTPFRVKTSQKDLIDAYSSREDGGLEPIASSPDMDKTRTFKQITEDFSIDFVVVRGQDLTAETIDEKLKNGHVMLIFNVAPHVSHTNVVYGVGCPTGKDKLISVMDPSGGGFHTNRPISFYQGFSFIIVAWPHKI
jgi:hypothetical protein